MPSQLKKGETLDQYHERMWDLLDPDVKVRAIGHLRKQLTPELIDEVARLMNEDPDGWAVIHHFTFGMAVRNELRAAVKDHELPTGNWDDYYVKALEETVKLDPRYIEPGPSTFRGHEVPPPGDCVVFYDDRRGAARLARELGTYAKHSARRGKQPGGWSLFSVVKLPDYWRELPGAGE